LSKFHINKNGVPALCRAKNGNCPLGKHYETEKEAQKIADKMHQERFGILGSNLEEEKKNEDSPRQTKVSSNQDGDKSKKVRETKEKRNRDNSRKAEENFKKTKGGPKQAREKTHKKARTIAQYKSIERRKTSLKNKPPKKIKKYIDRCISSERIRSYKKSNRKSGHLVEDRSYRAKKIKEIFGIGNLVGYYNVNHYVKSKDKNPTEQTIELRDTGQIIIYDKTTKVAITTFVINRDRAESMMLYAGEIPEENWLKKVKENHLIAKENKLD